MSTTREPNAEQHKAIQRLNDKWGVADWEVNADGTVYVQLDDGDEFEVSIDGTENQI